MIRHGRPDSMLTRNLRRFQAFGVTANDPFATLPAEIA